MDTLLEAAGCDPSMSLAALCGAAAAVHFPGARPAELVSLLGAHSQVVAGRAVASVLLQRTSPAAFLTADQVPDLFFFTSPSQLYICRLLESYAEVILEHETECSLQFV